MKVLVTGGREYGNKPGERERLNRVLTDLVDPLYDTLIHGHCKTGADHHADLWAIEQGMAPLRFPVDHSLDGPWPGAGPRRNERMYLTTQPDWVIAFPGGRGTASMLSIARKYKDSVIWTVEENEEDKD